MADPLHKLDDLISVLKGERDERREHGRAKTLKRGKIVYKDGASTMRCFILDLSSTGARLRPANAEDLPDTFELQIEHDLSMDCEIVNRDGSEIGVSFLLPK